MNIYIDPLTCDLPAPHSRGVERDRDLFCAGFSAAEEKLAAMTAERDAAEKELEDHNSASAAALNRLWKLYCPDAPEWEYPAQAERDIMAAITAMTNALGETKEVK